MALKFRVELVWQDEKETASSIYLTGDGRVILQGRAISPQQRAAMSLPADGEMISVDRSLIRAIKEMLWASCRWALLAVFLRHTADEASHVPAQLLVCRGV